MSTYSKPSPNAIRFCPAANPSSAPTTVELAWAAGFVDGDGSIGAYWDPMPSDRRVPTVRIRLTVAQNDLPTLQYLQAILGERSVIYPLRRARCHNKQMWNLVVNGAHAVAALRKIAPYLFRKQPEYFVCEDLHAQTRRPGRSGYPPHEVKSRRALVNKLSRLK